MSVSAGLKEGGKPALKAAAAGPRAYFTAAAAEAGNKEDPPALKAAATDPEGTFTAAASKAGKGEEPQETAGDACTSEGGAGGAEEEAAGEPGTVITGETTGEGCEGEDEPVAEMSWFSAGSTRSL